MDKKNSKLLIIDSFALIFRSYFALEKLQMRSSKTQDPTWAVYGYFKTLFSVIDELKPNYVIAAWDARGKTFRDDIDDQYKKNRPPAPDDLPSQINKVAEILSVLKIPRIESSGFEADDVIGTLSKQAAKKDTDVIIVTLDKDLLQLISNKIKVKLFRPFQGDSVLYNDEVFFNKFGFTPIQLIDYKSLVGDPSDNIKGVKGIGDKGATALIKQWNNINNIYSNIDKIEPLRMQKLLIANQNDADTAKRLATIECNIPQLELNLSESIYGDYESSQVREIFTEIEFESLLSKIPNYLSDNKNKKNRKSKIIILDEKNYETFVSEVMLEGRIAFLPLSQIINDRMFLAGVSFSHKDNLSYYLHFGSYFDEIDNSGESIKILKDICNTLISSLNVQSVTHNAKMHIKFFELLNSDIFLHNINFDTSIAGYLLGFINISVDELIMRELSNEIIAEDVFYGKGKNKFFLDNKTIEESSKFISERSANLLLIKDKLVHELEKIDLLEIYTDIDMPHLEVLVRMEQAGVLIDRSVLEELSKRLNVNILKLEKEIFKSAGHEFLISSPKQLAEILFTELNLPKTRKNKTSWVTDAQALKSLVTAHPIINDVLQWRELTKIKTTYADALPKQISNKTGKIHTVFSQVSTSTGRLTSNAPNLQNIPVRSPIGKEIRSAFVASMSLKSNKFLVSFDYSQIELRVLAHLSKDRSLVQSFIDQRDIHAETAAKIYNISIDQVSLDQRRHAKVFNFGIIYGLSAHGLMQREQMSREEAEQAIENYFKAYPQVDVWRKKIIADASKNGYVETLLGRRRYIPNINAQNKNLQLAAERTAINMPVQGTASDIIKTAMNDIDKELLDMRKKGFKTTMILQIHDELIFEVPKNEIDDLDSIAYRLMPSMLLDVPLIIERKIGKSWGEML
jgi:DNA polymerase-1